MRTLLLAAMMTLAACGSQQQPDAPKSIDEINQLIAIADKAVGVAQKVYADAPATDVQGATREMLTALDNAREQIDEILRQVADLDHLGEGKQDPMGVSGCVGSHRTQIHDIEALSPTAASIWSMKVGQCAASAIVYFKSAPPGDSSALALALSIIDPVMLVAGARSGLRKGALVHYLESNESIIEKLGPACGDKTGEAVGADAVSYQCAAYEVAIAVRPKLQPLAEQVKMSP